MLNLHQKLCGLVMVASMCLASYTADASSYMGGGLTAAIANSSLNLIDSNGFKFHILHDRGTLPGAHLFVGRKIDYLSYSLSGEADARVVVGRTSGEALNNSIHLPRVSMPYTFSMLFKPAIELPMKGALFGIAGIAVSKFSLLQSYNANIGYELKAWRPGYVVGLGASMPLNKKYTALLDYRLECYSTIYQHVSANNFRDKFKPSFQVLSLSIAR